MAFSGYIALGSWDGVSVFTESTASGYVRAPITFSTVSKGIIQANGLPITFLNTDALTQVNAYAFYQNSTGGYPILVYPLGISVDYSGLLTISPYNITFDLIAGVNGANQAIDLGGANVIAGIGGAFIQNSRVLIPSSKILTMSSAPVQLVPAPASNQIIVYVASLIVYNYGTTSYTYTTGNGQINLSFGLGTPTVVSTASGFLNNNPSMAASLRPSTSAILQLPQCQGKAMTISTASDPTGGDGTVDVSLWYTVYNM